MDGGLSPHLGIHGFLTAMGMGSGVEWTAFSLLFPYKHLSFDLSLLPVWGIRWHRRKDRDVSGTQFQGTPAPQDLSTRMRAK